MLPSGAMVTPVPPSPWLPELDIEPLDELDEPPPLLLLFETPPPLPEPPPLVELPLPPLPPELLPPDELEPMPVPWPPCVLVFEAQPRTTVRDAKATIVVIFMVKLTP